MDHWLGGFLGALLNVDRHRKDKKSGHLQRCPSLAGLGCLLICLLVPGSARAQDENTGPPGVVQTSDTELNEDVQETTPTSTKIESNNTPPEPSSTQSESPAPNPSEPKLTKSPVLKTFVPAIYPETAKTEGKSGDVILALTIQTDGSVTDVEVVQTLGFGFDEAAVTAVEQFRFEPAEIDNQVAAVRIQYRYSFTLEEVREAVKPTPKTGVDVKTGRLVGTLYMKGSRTPLVGIEVKLASERTALTDENGRFAFDAVTVGEVVVEIDEPDLEPTLSKEEVLENQETDVTYYVPKRGFDDTVTVRAKRIKKEVVRRTVTVEEVRLIPGTNGDALGIVQNLPGAARTSFGSTELILRGGGQTQVYLNQQPIPLAFHFGGIRSTVASSLIDNIDIYPSNYGVEYGRVNGGAVNVTLRRPKTDRVHGIVEADVFDAGALVEGPVGENGAFALAFRRSYLDVIAGAVIPEDGPIKITTLPRYYDGQAIYDWRKGDHELNLMVYGSSDKFVIVFEEPVEEEPRIQGEGVFALEWYGTQANLKSRLTDAVRNELSVAWLRTMVEVRFGTLVDLDFDFQQWLIRDTITFKPSQNLKLRLGTDLDLTASDIYAFGAGGPDKEGESDSPITEEAIETQDKSQYTSVGFFMDLEYVWGDLKLIPGVRFDRLGTTRENFLQPRMVTRYSLNKDVDLKAGYGWYVQSPQGDELTVGDGPKPTAETSVHYSVGYEHRLTELLELDLSLFYKTFDNLVRQAESTQIEFNNDGIGRAYGLELLLRHNMGPRFFGWIAYTLQRSERRDSPSDAWRPFDQDQTHNFIVLGQYKITPKWSVGVRWRYVTGNPETPVIGSIYSADNNVYVPKFGATNSGRQPPFHQLDLRVDRLWTFDTWKLTGYLDIRNVYNQANGSERVYSYDYAEEERSTEIPIVPSFGLRGEF